MKNYNLILFCFLAAFSAKSQDCKPDINQVDQFTKQKIVFCGGSLYNAVMFSDKDIVLDFYIGAVNDTMPSSMVYLSKPMDSDDADKKQDAREDLQIAKGSLFSVVLDNDQSLQFQALFDGTVNKKKSMGTLVYSVGSNYAISWDEMKLLGSHQIKAFRLQLANIAPIEGKVKEKLAKKLMEKFACMVSIVEKK